MHIILKIRGFVFHTCITIDAIANSCFNSLSMAASISTGSGLLSSLGVGSNTTGLALISRGGAGGGVCLVSLAMGCSPLLAPALLHLSNAVGLKLVVTVICLTIRSIAYLLSPTVEVSILTVTVLTQAI